VLDAPLTVGEEREYIASFPQRGEVTVMRCRFTGAVHSEERGNRAGLRLQGATAGLVRDCVAAENNDQVLG
jgi:hypothetical protein